VVDELLVLPLRRLLDLEGRLLRDLLGLPPQVLDALPVGPAEVVTLELAPGLGEVLLGGRHGLPLALGELRTVPPQEHGAVVHGEDAERVAAVGARDDGSPRAVLVLGHVHAVAAAEGAVPTSLEVHLLAHGGEGTGGPAGSAR
jgi:hypothetical protein